MLRLMIFSWLDIFLKGCVLIIFTLLILDSKNIEQTINALLQHFLTQLYAQNHGHRISTDLVGALANQTCVLIITDLFIKTQRTLLIDISSSKIDEYLLITVLRSADSQLICKT